MMTSVSTIEAHQEHCQPYLLTLRMIAHRGTGPVLTRLGAEVAQATQTVLAEAEAAARDAADIGAVGPGAAVLVEVRLHRLAVAADDAIAAAGDADCGQLRCHLHRFEALTAAIWTVLQAVHGAGGPGRSAG
jgi:hypothetical protein